MARDESLPFARGETFYNGGTIDANDLGGPNLEGRVYLAEVNTANGYTQNDPSGRQVRLRVVRNVSGVNLKPGRLVKYKAINPYETQVDGYTFAVGDRPAGVVDEFLPAAGVPNNDLFYIVIDGPTKVTQLSASASVLVIADRIVPGTGTSATNDDAGRVAKQDITGEAAALGNNIQNAVGFAGEASNSVEDALFQAVVHLG